MPNDGVLSEHVKISFQ